MKTSMRCSTVAVMLLRPVHNLVNKGLRYLHLLNPVKKIIIYRQKNPHQFSQ